MSLYNTAVEKIILPASDLALKKSISKHMRWLLKSQWWSYDRLVDYQNQKLRELIGYAYKNIPYYEELFNKLKLKPADIRSREDLHKIPLLTKAIIRENFPHKLTNKHYPKSRIIPHKSSGSTGQPMQYWVSKDAYSFNIACNLRGWYWMGYRLGDKFVKISQYDRQAEKQIQDIFLRTEYLSSSKLDDQSFKEFISVFRKFKPSIIRSYPDPLFFLAKYMVANDISDIRPKVLTTTGNMLLPGVREVVEQAFDCKIYDSYRCEGGPNVFESPAHETYLVSMEYGISEILRENRPAKPGEEGRHITTDLHNYAMPFIRYDSQDVVVKGTQACSSGRALETIDKIYGRASDILITPSKKYLIVLHFADYFDKFDSVEQFQVKQTALDHIDMYLKTNAKFNADHQAEILKYWQDFIGSDVNVNIELKDKLESTASGKWRFIIRDKSISLDL